MDSFRCLLCARVAVAVIGHMGALLSLILNAFFKAFIPSSSLKRACNERLRRKIDMPPQVAHVWFLYVSLTTSTTGR